MNTLLEKIWKEGKNVILVSVVGISAFALCGTVFATGLLNFDFSDLDDTIDDGQGWEKFENTISFCSALSDKLCTTTDKVGEISLEGEAYVSSGRDGFCGEAGLKQRFLVPEGAKTLKFDAEAYTLCDGDHTILSEEEILKETLLPGGIMGGIVYRDPITGEEVQDWLDMPGVVSCPILSNVGSAGIQARVNNYMASSGGNGTIQGFYSMYPELQIKDIIGTRRADQRAVAEAAFTEYPEATTAVSNEIEAAQLADVYTAQTVGANTLTAAESYAINIGKITGTDGWTPNADGSVSLGGLTIRPTNTSDGDGTVSAQSTTDATGGTAPAQTYRSSRWAWRWMERFLSRD
jgi:hypothetical protein